MEPASTAPGFATSGNVYDQFMGRYSKPLSAQFADFARVRPGLRALDVGCGPGALTSELARRLGPGSVAACDPSASFAAACRQRNPGVRVIAGAAEDLPFPDAKFDLVLAQLVLHFLADPERAGAEMRRVARPGATIAAAVWDFTEGMELLRAFWDAALTVDPDAPDELTTLRFGRSGEIAKWLTAAGLDEVEEATITVSSRYGGFAELWNGFLSGVGPAGSYCIWQPPARQDRLRRALFDRLGRPAGAFRLSAVARVGRGTVPGAAQPPA